MVVNPSSGKKLFKKILKYFLLKSVLFKNQVKFVIESDDVK